MKLKIRTINESDKKILTEADVDKGYRIKAIQALSNKIGDAVKNTGYKYKPVGATGFYIMPSFGYLGKLELTGTNDAEPTFNVKINDIFAKDLPVNGKIIKKLTYKELLKTADDIGLALANTLISPAKFANVSENLTEDRILEYGPLSALKGIFQKVTTKVGDFFAENSAENAEKNGIKAILEGINETLSEALNTSIKTLLSNGKQYVTVKSTINDKTLILELKCDFVTAITFNADPIDARKIIVSKLLTPLGEVNIKGKTIPQVLAMIGNVLKIKFNPEDIELDIKSTKDVEKDKEDNNSSDTSDESTEYWSYVIGKEIFNELIKEGMNEDGADDIDDTEVDEAYKLKKQASKYQTAFEKIKEAKDDEAKYALVKYFLLKETNGQLTEEEAKNLDQSLVVTISDIIEEGGFNPNTSPALLYILMCIKNGKKDLILKNDVAISLAQQLPECCKRSQVLEQPKSAVYSNVLFNSSNDVDTLVDLLEYWYAAGYKAQAFSKKVLTNLAKSEASKKKLADRFEIANPEAFVKCTETPELKKSLLLSPDRKKFRKLSEIENIADTLEHVYDASISAKVAKGDKSAGDYLRDPANQSVVNKIAKKALNNKGEISMDKLKEIIQSDRETAAEAQKLLDALKIALGA